MSLQSIDKTFKVRDPVGEVNAALPQASDALSHEQELPLLTSVTRCRHASMLPHCGSTGHAGGLC